MGRKKTKHIHSSIEKNKNPRPSKVKSVSFFGYLRPQNEDGPRFLKMLRLVQDRMDMITIVVSVSSRRESGSRGLSDVVPLSYKALKSFTKPCDE